MNHCEACHSQLRDDGSHYQMTTCVQEEIANLKAENERLLRVLAEISSMCIVEEFECSCCHDISAEVAKRWNTRKAQSEWVSVDSGELPSIAHTDDSRLVVSGMEIPPMHKSDAVLVVDKGVVRIKCFEWLGDKLVSEFTHWQPLPKGPSE